MTFRDFLYLDRPLVRDFLAQVEGGSVDELKETETTTGGGSLGGQFGPKSLRIQGDASKEHSIETEAVLRQVASSEFDRFVSYLESEDLKVFDEIQLEDIGGIVRKQFFEADARVRLSGMQQMMGLLGNVSSLMPLLQSMGSINVDETTRQAISAFSSLNALETKVSIIATVPGSAGFKIGLELDPAHAFVEKWDVDASVLVKVQRVLRPGEKHLLGDPLGGLLKFMPADKQDELLATFSSPAIESMGVSGDAEVTYPGVIGTPIAIYR